MISMENVPHVAMAKGVNGYQCLHCGMVERLEGEGQLLALTLLTKMAAFTAAHKDCAKQNRFKERDAKLKAYRDAQHKARTDAKAKERTLRRASGPSSTPGARYESSITVKPLKESDAD